MKDKLDEMRRRKMREKEEVKKEGEQTVNRNLLERNKRKEKGKKK